MASVGHRREAGQSTFRVFAPGPKSVAVLLPDDGKELSLARDDLGYWTGQCEPLADGTRYLVAIDGHPMPDVASRSQPDGVHSASAVATPVRARSEGWRGVKMADAVIYELHLGTFTPEGTLEAATARLGLVAELGITVVELLPIAAFPGRWNWGYDGTYLFALHAGYGSYAQLARFIEEAHRLGMAVVLDVVHNHFGPEGNYSAAFAPYTKRAETPWGAAINFNGDFNYGVREFFLENIRFWVEEIGFDGLRMDAVSMIFDDMPVHILREANDLAREIGAREHREILMIAEHLRNNRFVTSEQGYGFGSQWNDDLTHAVFALITRERRGHYENFGSFDDVVKAFERAHVLDGTRFDHYRRYLLGTDGTATRPEEHVVYIQDHDQVGNRPYGDRMTVTYGRQRALFALTAMLASPYVPMFFMGDEYGESAPFLFFEDFSDPGVIEGVRNGRRAEYDFGEESPPDPHAQASFEASKLQWALRETEAGRDTFSYFQTLVAWKRKGELGPRDRSALTIEADRERSLLRIQTAHTLTVLNFSTEAQHPGPTEGWHRALACGPSPGEGRLCAFGAAVYRRSPATT